MLDLFIYIRLVFMGGYLYIFKNMLLLVLFIVKSLIWEGCLVFEYFVINIVFGYFVVESFMCNL